jgi:hypothetical protein
MYFCTSVYFKTSEKKTPTDPDKISKEIFPIFCKPAVGKFALNFRLTYRVNLTQLSSFEQPDPSNQSNVVAKTLFPSRVSRLWIRKIYFLGLGNSSMHIELTSAD